MILYYPIIICVDNKRSIHYEYVDILRVFFCISVLLYHLDIMKGGFFAVCGFFVISGYFLSSSLDREGFDLFRHYAKRFRKLYIPLVVTALLTVLYYSVNNMVWITLKPEVTSILLGYDNIYQISTGADYFARSVDSPMLHMWYISILLQYELIFPLIFLLFKKIGNRSRSSFGTELSLFIFTVSIIYFYVSFNENGQTLGYYGSIERLFSFAAGIFLYFVKKNTASPLNRKVSKALFFILILSMFFIEVYIGPEISFIPELMVLFTFISLFALSNAIDLGYTNDMLPKLFKDLSGISYEIYLFHYPLIFILPYLYQGAYTKEGNTVIVILVTVLSSLILHRIFNVKGRWDNGIVVLLCIVLGFTSSLGAYAFALEKDHTEEMESLQKELSLQEEELKRREQEYLDKLAEEKEKWDDLLSTYEDEDYADKMASSEMVCGIGDSVMLGASPGIYQKLDRFYCDAVVSRPGLYVRDIMADMKRRGLLTNTVLIHIGHNGGLWEPQIYSIMNYAVANNIQVFWMTVCNNTSKDVWCNDDIRTVCRNYDNAHLIDWEVISKGHRDWFGPDGLHMSPTGAYYYGSYVYEAIHGYYVEKYEAIRQAVLDEYNELEDSKYSFYGNDLLLSLNNKLYDSFTESSFTVLETGDFDALKGKLNEDMTAGVLSRNVVLILGPNEIYTDEEMTELTDMLKDRKLTVISYGDTDYTEILSGKDVSYINLGYMYDDWKTYFHPDRIHLNENGINIVLDNIIDSLSDEDV